MLTISSPLTTSMSSLGLDSIKTLAGSKLISTLATYSTAGTLTIITEGSSVVTGDMATMTGLFCIENL
jgi:hypothetical protein